MTVKVIICTVRPNGLRPQLLVFGVLPKLPEISGKDFPTNRQRMREMVTARKEYEQLIADRMVRRGLQKIPPSPSQHFYLPGYSVLVYIEGLGNYSGLHYIESVHGKHVRVHLG